MLIVDRLAGHIELCGGPHIGLRAVGWTTLVYIFIFLQNIADGIMEK